MVNREIPTKAVTSIIVGVNKIHQELEFYYFDPGEQFSNLQQTGALEGEIEFMVQNMEYYLNQDKLFLNSYELPLHVKSCQVQFREGEVRWPVAKFLIDSADYSLKKGVNTIQLDAEEEKVNYTCHSTWNFPGMVIKVVSTMKFRIEEHKVILEAVAGEIVGGSELFKFMNR